MITFIENVLESIVGYGANEVAIIAIMIIYIAYFIFSGHIKINRNIKKINKDLKSENISNKYTLFKDVLLKNEYFKDFINAYKNAEINEETEEKTLPNFQDYFNTSSIINYYSNRKFVELLPGFCTAVGILFTFIGLYSGLNNIEIGNVESTQRSIVTLMGGMSVAFMSSILGIFASIILNIIDKSLMGKMKKQVKRTYKELNEKSFKIPYISYHEYQAIKLMKNQNDNLKTMVEDLSLKLSETISKELSPRFDEMNQLNERLVDSIQGTQVEGMDRIVDSFMQEVNGLMGYQFENLADTVEELVDWQKQTKDTLDKMIEEMTELSKKQMEINESSDHIINKFNNSIDDMNKTVGVLSDSLENVVEINENFENQTQYFMEYMNKSKEQIEINNITLEKVSEISNHFKETTNNFKKELFELNGKLDDSSRVFTESLETSLDRTFKSFDDNLTEITSKLSSVIYETQQGIEDIPDFVENLNRNINKFNEVFVSNNYINQENN